jgi:hypothetical protein
MALGHSPRIVTDGMVLYLDAANPKNYNLTEVEYLVVGGGGGYNDYYFNGRVYSGNIHNRALTAAEIQQNFNATRSRFGI